MYFVIFVTFPFHHTIPGNQGIITKKTVINVHNKLGFFVSFSAFQLQFFRFLNLLFSNFFFILKRISMQTAKSAEQISMRRLRPLYDLIDAGQNKKAISEAEKVLKKHPNLHTAKALKALALIRSDRYAEAETLLGALENVCRQSAGAEIDDGFVQALSHCFRDMNSPERIASLYTELTRHQPNNENFWRELFFSYARLRNCKEQQRVALQLAKLSPNYHLWAVMSILIQGFENKQLGQSMLFALAERMLDKVGDAELLQKPGGFDLRLLTLEAREQFGRAAELIRTHCRFGAEGAPFPTDQQMKQKLISVIKEAGEHAELFRRCMDNVTEEPNEWNNWVNLVDAFMCLEDDKDNKLLSELIQKCLQCTTDAKLELLERRGSLLARLLILERLSSSPDRADQSAFAEQQLGTSLEAMKAIVSTYHDRPFTFMDIKRFIPLLTVEEQQNLLAFIDSLRTQNTDGPSASDLRWTTILWQQTSFYCTPISFLSDEHLKESIKVLIGKISPANGSKPEESAGSMVAQLDKIMAKNDSKPDALAVSVVAQLLAHHFWEFFIRKNDYKILVTLLALLEHLNARHENALIAIILCRIYALFGDVSRINDLIKQIQLKFIQRDSLAFLQFFVADNFGQFKTAGAYYASMVTFYDSNQREISESIVAAFKHGKFMQIPKLNDFVDTCMNSVYSVGARLMSRAIGGCFLSNALETASDALTLDPIDWDRISDNRDCNVMAMFLSDAKMRTMREESFREIISYLKLHFSVCRAIGSIGREKLKTHADAFFATLEELRRGNGFESQKILENFTNTGLSFLLSSNGPMELPLRIIRDAIDELEDPNLAKNAKPIQERAQEFAALLDVLLNNVCLSRPIASLGDQIGVVRDLAKLLEMVALSLIGAKKIERLKGLGDNRTATATSAAAKGDGKATKSAKKEDKNKQKQQTVGDDESHPTLLLSTAIRQALQKLDTFIAKTLPKAVENAGNLNFADSFALEELFPKQFQAEITVELKKLIERGISPVSRLDQLRAAISRLLDFC